MPLQIEFLNGHLQGRILRAPVGILTIGGEDADISIDLDGPEKTLEIIFDEDDNVNYGGITTCRVNGKKRKIDAIPKNEVITIAGLAFLISDEGAPPTDKKVAKNQKLYLLGAYLSVFFVLCIFAIRILMPSGDIEPTESLQDWLVKQHNHPELRELGVTVRPDKTFYIYGHCSNQSLLESFLVQLKERNINYYLDTQCQDSVIEQVRYILDENAYKNVKITNGQFLGDIVLKGDVRSDDKWQRIVKELSSIQGLDKWSVTRGNRKHQSDALLSASKRANILGSVSISKKGKQLIVSGEIDELQKESFEDEIEDYIAINELTLIYQDIPNNNLKISSFFNKQLVSIGGNIRKPYILLSDGTKLETGAKINDGYEIVKITSDDGLDIYKDGSLIHLTIAI